MMINLNPKRIYFSLLVITGILIIGNIFVLAHFHFELVERKLERTTDLFHMDMEGNLPTLFSFFLIFLCSAILFLIGRAMKMRNEPSFGWFLLSGIFLFLALDEGIQIHEVFNTVVDSKFETGGIFYYSWTIPYLFFITAFVLVFIPFLNRLPIESRKLFILSGGVFVTGAVGMEMVGGYRMENYGRDFYYGLIFTVEEVLEMVGMATFCYTLLRFAEEKQLIFSFRVGSGALNHLRVPSDSFESRRKTPEKKPIHQN